MPRVKKARLRGPEPANEAAMESSTSGATADGGQMKQAAPRRNIRGRRGGLKEMPNMPLDILIEVRVHYIPSVAMWPTLRETYVANCGLGMMNICMMNICTVWLLQIFGHMHPRDLLNLARTTKAFREFLMSRNATPFWKAARQQVDGLPDCPTHLSEPAYANLVFFSHCHECLKPNVKNTLWEFGVRYCPSCRETLVTNDHYRELNFISDVIERTSVYHGYLNCVQAPYSKGSRYKDNHYHIVELREFKAKWASLSTDDEKRAFITGRLAVVKDRKEHAQQMSQWQKRQEQTRSHELDTIRDKRLADIRKRLEEDGWAEELRLMDDLEEWDLSRHKAARKSQKLTDYGWQSIREELNKHMENVRTKRLARERLRLTCARLGLLHQALLEYRTPRLPMSADADWKPIFTDFALMPTFRDLMEASADTEVTKDALLEVCEAQIPTLEAQWREDRRRDFAVMVTRGAGMFPGLTLPEDDDTLLSLAITAFDCQNCSYRGIRWPQVLAHRCVRSVSFMAFFYGDVDRYRHAIARAAIEHKASPPWPQDASFSFSPAALERTFAVITACGKDPSTATFEEMEVCDVRLLCRPCCSPTIECMAFDWKSAARHGRQWPGMFLLTVEQEHTPEWVRLDAENAKKVKQLEVVRREKHDARAAPLSTNFGCTQCRYRGTVDRFQEHCKKRVTELFSHEDVEDYAYLLRSYDRAHDVEDAQLGTDYYRHTDNTPYTSNPIWIYPEARSKDDGVAADVQAGNGFVATVPLM